MVTENRASRTALAAFLAFAAGVSLFESCLLASLEGDPRMELLSAAVTLDVTLFVPIAWWLVVVRRGRAAPLTLAPVFLLSILAASQIVPGRFHGTLARVELLAIPAELVVLGVVAWKVRASARRLRAEAQRQDVLASLQVVARELAGPGRLADVVASEAAMLWFAFGAWRSTPPAGAGVFTIHRRSAAIPILGAVALMVLVEALGLHFLVQRWSPLGAWVLTASSVWALLLVVAYAQSVRLLPIVVDADGLLVRRGLFARVRIAWGAIARVERSPRATQAKDEADLGLFATPQFGLELRAPAVLEGPYGSRREVRRILLAVDDPEGFAREVEARVTRA